MSNIISATPTVDTTESHISKPTWVVSINGSPNTEIVLRSVTLSYGTSFSSAIFEVNQDPDTGSFPSYNDDVDVVVNGRNIFKGKIKGITSIIARRGLGKTFTALANITTLTEKVVDPDNKDFNDKNTAEADRLNVSQIVTQILGNTPDGTPTDDPGELHLTDMTLLDAVQTTVNKVGNYKLFWNKDTNLLEVYRFGQGGDVTRQFVKGVNIISKTITENRQGVVDKLTLIGPPRAKRVRKIVDATLEPDENGVFRLSFTIAGKNIREIVVEGQYRDRPTIEFNGNLQLLPEDMDFLINVSGPLAGFAEWPFFFLGEFGNTKGDVGFRPALRSAIIQPTIFSTIGTSTQFDNTNDSVQVFLSDIPKTYFHIFKQAAVDKTKLGLSGGFEALDTVAVRVLIFIGWVRGQIRVTYTVDEDAPTLTVGSGTVERTITDSQYQIVDNRIDADPIINNESEVLALMQKRLDAEFEKLNRPPIGGTIVIPGDETLDLKSTVIVDGSTKLDVVNISHNFTSGFTSSIALTNEPFVAAFISTSPAERRKQQERFGSQQTRFSFEEVEVDQETASQRQIEFQRRLEEAGLSSAIYQD